MIPFRMSVVDLKRALRLKGIFYPKGTRKELMRKLNQLIMEGENSKDGNMMENENLKNKNMMENENSKDGNMTKKENSKNENMMEKENSKDENMKTASINNSLYSVDAEESPSSKSPISAMKHIEAKCKWEALDEKVDVRKESGTKNLKESGTKNLKESGTTWKYYMVS